VEVLDVLEGPLLGPEGESWIKGPNLSKEFSGFLRVQALSGKASQDIESWKSCLKPLLDTKKEHVLSQLWYNINKVSEIDTYQSCLCSHMSVVISAGTPHAGEDSQCLTSILGQRCHYR
jgi:hypothetical protein